MTINSNKRTMAARRQGGQSRSYQPRRPRTEGQMKALQSAKIRELGYALAMAGILTLDKQAEALGLCRSTAWTILKGDHKASGLSATTINRMLKAPRLPPFVRAKVLEYVEEKATGRYGHGKMLRHKFIARLSIKQSERAKLEEIPRFQPPR